MSERSYKMGVYDLISVPCPTCGKRQEVQSKSGDCILAIYQLESTPEDVLYDVNRHAPFVCRKCGAIFIVKLTLAAESILLPNDEP